MRVLPDLNIKSTKLSMIGKRNVYKSHSADLKKYRFALLFVTADVRRYGIMQKRLYYMMKEETKEQNRKEWKNTENWTLPIGFYFSKKDTRWLVPRPNPTLGWTFNLGNKKGALAMLLSFLIPILLLTGVLLIFVLLSITKC